MNTVDIEAFPIIGVGGFVTRSRDGVHRIIQLMSIDGTVVNIAPVDATVLDGIRRVSEQLQINELETGEVMRELGLYREG